MKIEKIIFYGLIICFIFLAVHQVSAIETLGTFPKSSCISLKQLCGNCTFNNITSVDIKPKYVTALKNVAMTKIGTEYNYTFCNTTILGEYYVNGLGDIDGINTPWAYNFFITNTGYTPTGPQIAIYISLLILTLFIFAYSCSAFSRTPFKNARDAFGREIDVNYKKHLKLLWFFVAYSTLMIALWFAWTLGTSFLDLDPGVKVFQFFLYAMAATTLIIFAGGTLVWMWLIFQDRKLQAKLDRGLRGR